MTISVFLVVLTAVSLTIVYSQDCGSVEVCVQPRLGGQHRIFMTMTLNSILPGNLQSVSVAGYTYNIVSGSVSYMSTPGSAPNLQALSKTYSDFWDRSVGTGDVQIGFPFVRAYGLDNSFCYGNFRSTISVSSSGPPICSSSPMYRSEKVDFVLVVDTTGSMWDDIRAVQANASEIVSTLSSVSTSFRGAIVEYNDRTSAPDASIYQTFTTSVPLLLSAINNLTASGGGDYAECLYDGLALALSLPWDMSSRRITITMGDAPGKVCENGITVEDILSLTSFVDIDVDISPTTPIRIADEHLNHKAMKKISLKLPVKGLTPLYMVGTGTTPSDFKTLAEKSGGVVVESSGAKDVVKVIEEVIREGPEETKMTKDLNITLNCKASSAKSHVFVIENPNSFSVPFELQNLFARVRKNGVASPGKSTVLLDAVSRIYITFKWTKAESGETGSIVYTPKPCALISEV